MPEPAATPAAGRWAALRTAATARAAAIGLPTNALEAWRYVDLAPLKETFAAAASPAAVAIDPAWCVADAAGVLVLVDGVFRGALSRLPTAAAGVSASSLDELPATDADALARRWMDGLDACDDIGACWSLAHLAGGVRLRADAAVAAPVQIINVSTGGSHGCRVAIELGRAASLELVICHVALGATRSCLAVEAELAAGSSLRACELQFAGAPAAGGGQLLANHRLNLARDAAAHWTAAFAGAGLVRGGCEARLREAGASAAINGMAVLGGRRQAHHYVRVRHEAGQTSSQQLFKTIAGGAARASFDGLVAIAAGADGADASQHHHSLLLSPQARVDTRPQLDILADDVKAAHGATVGRPNPDELFYLRSRGLGERQALDLLTRGFALEVAALMTNPGARALAERFVVGSMD